MFASEPYIMRDRTALTPEHSHVSTLGPSQSAELAQWLDADHPSGVFAEGTLIDTPNGRVQIQSLSEGDSITTFKNGQVSVTSCFIIPQKSVPEQVLCIRAGYLNATHDLITLPQQLARLDHWLAAALFGTKFPFVTASRVRLENKIEMIPKDQTQFFRLFLGVRDAVTANGVMCIADILPTGSLHGMKNHLKNYEYHELTHEETQQALDAGSFFRRPRNRK